MSKLSKAKYKEFIISIIAVMGIQAISYFLIKTFISNYNTISTRLDFPLIKEFVYIYNSWYPFIILSVFIVFKNNTKTARTLLFTMLIAGILGHITFILYPTTIIRPSIEIKNLTDLLLDITYKIDSPAVNCLPSIHCIYCFITSFYICYCKELKSKVKIPFVIYSFLIVLSTLFTMQHIIEDVIFSLVYSSICITIALIFKDNINNAIKKVFG